MLKGNCTLIQNIFSYIEQQSIVLTKEILS